MAAWKDRKKTAIVVVSLALVLAVLLSVTLFARRNSGAANTALSNVIHLSKTELVNSISVSGTIESSNTQSVYSTLNYLVAEIYVRVGDKVAAGDLLATLDTAVLELDIAQQRSTLDNSQKNAFLDLQIKKLTYENLKKQYDNGLNTELVNAEATLETAEFDLQTKKETFENNKSLFASGYISGQELNQSETNYLLAVTTYDKAVSSLATTKIKVEQDLMIAEANLKNAEAAYQNDTQQIALQKLEKNLADSLIKAPLDGTVTAIYAKVGSPGSGLLFIIEDTETLIITAYVKEYDIGHIQKGQKVTIKADATGDVLLQGEVVKIAPTSAKSATGDTIVSSTAEFETQIAVLDHDTGLKIGMNTRLEIILEKKDGVYALPYDAVTVNAEGRSIIYAVTNENSKPLIKELVVDTGMETDFYTEVWGDGLSEGMMILNDAAGINSGNPSGGSGGPNRGGMMIQRRQSR